MKRLISYFLHISGLIILVLNLFGLVAGAIDGINNISKCDERTRWQYLAPAYRLGCWMSERVE